MALNADGKFLDRLIPSLISAGLAVAGMAVVFWAESRAADRETAETIRSLKEQLAIVKDEAKEQRQLAAADRQRTAELAGDVRSVLRSVSRIETLLDERNSGRRPGNP